MESNENGRAHANDASDFNEQDFVPRGAIAFFFVLILYIGASWLVMYLDLLWRNS
jgi:hypothetical protein